MEIKELAANYAEVWWVIMSVALVLILNTSTNHLQISTKFPKLTQFSTLVAPLLLAMSSMSGRLSFALYFLLIVVSIAAWSTRANERSVTPTPVGTIATFRVFILLFTIVAILAVDFNIFPHRFYKTHRYGASVMDIGVGAFVASNAFACSDAKSSRIPLSIVGIFRRAIPLLVVGFVRWASTAGTAYHVDPTEYGIHWNFFFSLAVVKILGPILIRLCPALPPGLIGFVIVSAYEFCIFHFDLATLVFGPDRSNFILANKEGIFSSIGLTGLYLIYVQLGRHLLPLVSEGRALRRTLTLMAIFWLVLTVHHAAGFQVSRRLANMGYVIWICAMAMSFISFCIVGDNFRVRMGVKLPELITAMNLTQLPVFLLANVFTGLVNLTLDTRAQSATVAHAVMLLYLASMVAAAFLIYRNETILNVVRAAACAQKQKKPPLLPSR